MNYKDTTCTKKKGLATEFTEATEIGCGAFDPAT